MELIEAKITAIICLILGSMLVGLLPSWISRYGRNNYPLLLSSLLCLGGGVLLSTSLVHMLPEIRESFPKYGEYTEVLFCAGFFILYLIDEAVHFCFGISHDHGSSSSRQHQPEGRRKVYGSVETQPLIYERQDPYNPHYEDVETITSNNQHHHHHHHNEHQQQPSQLCHIGHEEPCQNTPVNCFGLLAALSIHAVLEGLAVGLEVSPSQVFLLFGAIASHKLVVGFCLGVELASIQDNSALRHFIAIVIFSCGTPLGITVGMSIANIPKHIIEYLLPILQCLAGGTLLYVSVSEVLPRERARWHQQTGNRKAGIVQFLSVLTGFVIMTVLTHYMEH
ncbi:PREDICTED: zinc transporter ZIP3 [Nicrophorus vespilloides]|uniref:Zinc transporter ZIP3 n=1 Tax=Nicrophorus vespilloides TaxID=110193 RepID=A0ABM1MT81_NICVS|nr:PREDICTED: zinc transporter ZIP3 [Nicrophorus vespilloides]